MQQKAMPPYIDLVSIYVLFSCTQVRLLGIGVMYLPKRIQ